MNVEEALATMYNIKGAESKASLHVYEMLKEALDYAAKDWVFYFFFWYLKFNETKVDIKGLQLGA